MDELLAFKQVHDKLTALLDSMTLQELRILYKMIENGAVSTLVIAEGKGKK